MKYDRTEIGSLTLSLHFNIKEMSSNISQTKETCFVS